jgi:SAM-dependent methyltransferase
MKDRHVEGAEMNKGHMEFCTSADWQEILEKLILPGAIDRVDLGPRVVEIGPGPGFTTEVLSRCAEHVTAIEIEPALVDQLRMRLVNTNVEIVLGDARATGLPSGSFTGAASFHMLHHVPTDADQDAVFAELLRLVQPGGWALLADGFDSDEVRQFHEDDIYNPIDPSAPPARLGRAGYANIEVEQHDLGWYCVAEVPLADAAPGL